MKSEPLLRPWDSFNRELAAQVHPPDWTNSKPASRYNLVVIGAGTAGLVSAAGAAGLGAKVALIERHLMGGDCLNVGCVPSKALIGAARVAAAVRDGAEFGVQVPDGVRVDFGKAMERMRRLRASIAPHDSAQRFSDLGIDVFIGEGRFADSHTVEVATFTRELSDVDRAILEGRTNGFVRVHVRKGTDKIVGATIVARNAGDMISEVTLAMTHGLGLMQIANSVHPYPTQAEAIRQVGDAYNRTRLTPFAKSFFSRLMAWRR